MEKKEITILVSEEDYRHVMKHFANNGLGRPLVAVVMLRAVEGDENYDLNEFEK